MTEYTERFNRMFPYIMDRECEYVYGHQGDWKTNNGEYVRTEFVPGDDGGLTKFGIDQRAHPKVSIKSLTLDAAKEIYFKEWQKAPCDVGELPEKTSYVFFDILVLGGNAASWLQECLNNQGEKLDVDGHIGPMTITAANHHDDEKLAVALLARRRTYYMRVVDSHPNDAKFLRGWLNRNSELASYFGITASSDRIA